VRLSIRVGAGINQKEVGAVRSHDEAFLAVEQEISFFFDRSGGGSEKIRSDPISLDSHFR
jgi:hypothetical protein